MAITRYEPKETDFIELINDENFEQLTLAQKKPNIFNILSISRKELRHSNFLSWLLDPNGSHSLGNIFIKKFLRDILQRGKSKLDEIDVDNFNYSDVEIRREWNNIDILIILPELIVCVENKVNIKDHSDQLERYKNIVNENFEKGIPKEFVYLTPFGDPPTSDTAKNYYSNYSYENIEKIINRILLLYEDNIKTKVYNYIKDYHEILKEDILGTSDLVKKAQKLYRTHKETLDFIFEKKPDRQLEISECLIGIIKADKELIPDDSSKTYIRFDVPGFSIIPKNGFNWTKSKSTLLFEFRNTDSLSLHVVLGPGPDDDRKLIYANAKKNPEFFKTGRKAMTPIYSSLYHESFLSKKEVEDGKYGIDKIKKTITEQLNKFKSSKLPNMVKILVKGF